MWSIGFGDELRLTLDQFNLSMANVLNIQYSTSLTKLLQRKQVVTWAITIVVLLYTTKVSKYINKFKNTPYIGLLGES